MNLPNKLTLLRVAMIPVFAFFFLADFLEYHLLIAFGIFVVASLTDWLDGKIARDRGLVTDFGKLMDPLADKLLVMAACVLILGRGGYSLGIGSPGFEAVLAPVALIVILGRDLVVNAIRLVAAADGVVIAADIFGKLKTVFQMVWASLALLRMAFGAQGLAGGVFGVLELGERICFVGMLFFTLLSGFNYVWNNRSLFADA